MTESVSPVCGTYLCNCAATCLEDTRSPAQGLHVSGLLQNLQRIAHPLHWYTSISSPPFVLWLWLWTVLAICQGFTGSSEHPILVGCPQAASLECKACKPRLASLARDDVRATDLV